MNQSSNNNSPVNNDAWLPKYLAKEKDINIFLQGSLLPIKVQMQNFAFFLAFCILQNDKVEMFQGWHLGDIL